MKIAVNAKFLTQRIEGGVQRFAIEISRHLKKLKPEISFISSSGILHKELAEYLEAETYNGMKSQQIDLPVYLNKLKNPLLINLTTSAPFFYNNQIITIQDISNIEHPEWFNKKTVYYNNFIIRNLANKSLKILAGSIYSKNKIVEFLKINPSKIHVIYSAVAPEFYRALQKENIKNNKYEYILAVGSLNPRKNLKRLVDAFYKLKLKDIKLVIAGAPNKLFPKKNNISINNELENVIFTDYINNETLIDLYRNAIMLVYPSLYEGFGIPPIEAMACECPVISSNLTSLPEVIGNAAYYIDPFNTDDIAKAIHTLITDDNLKKDLINKGKERIKFFNWEKSAKTVLDLALEITGN
ncbi:MAG: glycosyltransferase family 4 protein [Candidatus Firestonebacteria bacterium]|nr:glycosyltransferase family 4 protein [Candidatus Firestonebacteria bacterium]